MTSRNIEVLAIGELNVDLILNEIDGFPVVGKEILAGDMNLGLGSSTAIFAANLSSLGAKVGFIGKIGPDSFGDLVRQNLNDKGIDTSFLIIDNSSATGATIVLNYSEDRAMVTFPGAMEKMVLNDINPEILEKARHIHFSSYFLQPGIRKDVPSLFSMAKKMGLTTSLDTQWDPTEKWDFDYKAILPVVDIFMPNEQEILHITGKNDLESALNLLAPYAKHIVIKRGNKGSLLWGKGVEIKEFPPYLNNQVVDAIGAGDSFNAGFIYKFIKGFSLPECADFGNVSGALNTMAAGGTGAFGDRKQIEEVLRTRFNREIYL
jgi:sugar/nucleoside kinase (ribokinase family)